VALVCTFGYTLCVPLERKGYESWAINALDLVLVVVLVKVISTTEYSLVYCLCLVFGIEQELIAVSPLLWHNCLGGAFPMAVSVFIFILHSN
jgi:hypothetical protein